MSDQAKLVDLRGEFGGAGGNANELINSSQYIKSPELRAAQNLLKDEKATEELDWDAVAAKGGKDETLIDASVRGPWVVACFEIPSGRTYKEAWPATEFGIKPSRGRKAEISEPDEGLADEREQAEERMQLQADAAAAARVAQDAARAAAERTQEKAAPKEKAPAKAPAKK